MSTTPITPSPRGSSLPAASYSHWLAGLYGDDQPVPVRPPLTGPITVDVAIVGAGYTGLWTAYELLRSRPDLKVAVLERHFAGYGASGRNGGAAIAQLNGHPGLWNSLGGPDCAVRMERAVQAGVDHIGDAVAREGIDCKFSKNGFLNIARNNLEKNAILASLRDDRANGFDESDTRWLDQAETAERIHVDRALGAKFNAHCASFDPGRLVRGLAETVERLGGQIYEGTPVTEIRPRQAHTERGVVHADYVLRATEAYTPSLAGHRRRFVPIHTSMIATEPIAQSLWDEIGWARRETVLAEHRFLHLQHTSDGRVTIGGDDNRVPYRFGSQGSRDEAIRENLRRQYHAALIKLFPPAARRAGRPHLERRVRGGPRLGPFGGAGPLHGARLGGRLRRRGRGRLQHGRPHAARPRARPGDRHDLPALGSTASPQLGAGTAAVPGLGGHLGGPGDR